MAATDYLNQHQWPRKGNEELDKYVRPANNGIHGTTGNPSAKKYPKMGDEALDREYKSAHGSR